MHRVVLYNGKSINILCKIKIHFADSSHRSALYLWEKRMMHSMLKPHGFVYMKHQMS